MRTGANIRYIIKYCIGFQQHLLETDLQSANEKVKLTKSAPAGTQENWAASLNWHNAIALALLRLRSPYSPSGILRQALPQRRMVRKQQSADRTQRHT